MAVERGKCKEKYTKKSKSPACFEGFPLSLSKFAISFWNIDISNICLKTGVDILPLLSFCFSDFGFELIVLWCCTCYLFKISVKC